MVRYFYAWTASQDVLIDVVRELEKPLGMLRASLPAGGS
jgi:hypothetical protein